MPYVLGYSETYCVSVLPITTFFINVKLYNVIVTYFAIFIYQNTG